MHKCLEKHSCMSCTLSIAILNGTCFLRSSGIDFVLIGECYSTKYYNNNNPTLIWILYTIVFQCMCVSMCVCMLTLEYGVVSWQGSCLCLVHPECEGFHFTYPTHCYPAPTDVSSLSYSICPLQAKDAVPQWFITTQSCLVSDDRSLGSLHVCWLLIMFKLLNSSDLSMCVGC